MAITKVNGRDFRNVNCDEFYLDSAADVSSLPTTSHVGSSALVIGLGDIYMIDSTGIWKLTSKGNV